MAATELQFEVVIDPKLPPKAADLVTFETGATPEDWASRWAYDHHGPAFHAGSPGALTLFFEDLIMGAPMPLKMGIHTVKGVDTVLAVALFTGRDLAVHPATPAFVTATDLFHRYGVAGLAHIPADVGKFLTLLSTYFPQGLPKEQVGERLTHAVAWVREYILEDRLPHLGKSLPAFRVVDIGTNGFVIAECNSPSAAVWGEVYRAGFLRGVVFGPDRNARRAVVAARKSRFIELDLANAVRMLNELERAAGGDSEWQADEFFAWSPAEGTLILPSEILDILLRC